MAAWGWVAAAYGVYMAVLAAGGRAGHGRRAFACAAGFAIVSGGAAMVDGLVAQVMLPGMVVLGGYWLSGLFVGTPQPRLEAWLLRSDRVLFKRLSFDRLLARAPAWLLEALEWFYSMVYVVVVAGAVAMASVGRDAVLAYWTVVLPSELICYAALPFVRSRPPRSLEPAGVIARRSPVMRRVNDAIVGKGSIQVNTIPSGHVAGAVAAGLAVSSSLPVVGAVLLVTAALIAVAATVGRYHYAVDCVLGAAVAVLVWFVV